MTKFCKDCKYYKGYWFSEAVCTNPKLLPPRNPQYLVDGKKNDPDNFWGCYSMREFDAYCGAEGRYFEPRPIIMAFKI